MNRWLRLLACAAALILWWAGRGQTVGALSVYEGQRVLAVSFDLTELPADTAQADTLRRRIEAAFPVEPYSHFSRMQAEYYLSQLRELPEVRSAALVIAVAPEGGLYLTVSASILPAAESRQKQGRNIFRDIRSFPVIYARGNTFLTMRGTLSEMAYSNRNAWFARPEVFTAGNPLADAPASGGWSAWLEGYAMRGLYGIARIVPRWNLHLYGGVSYIVAFSAGRELFSRKARLRGGVEDAFAGVVAGGTSASGHAYSFNLVYGRKSFILGKGWLIVNTAMNGEQRAALQLNPRWAARRLLQAGGRYGEVTAQFFQLRPDELRSLDSRTVLDGINLEWTPATWAQTGAALLYVPRSQRSYYLPDGQVRSRRGLWVYNLRLYGNPAPEAPGPFYEAEAGYQRNAHFKMRAWAWYVHLGWNFARTRSAPSLSYRFAFFSGDNPRTAAYERWDPLYTGGNGEQWVQGGNMYKIVQNSNEITHRLQFICSPLRKMQLVAQAWAFAAPRRNNLGGNPALAQMKGRYYGTEFDLTLKYYHSAHWYLHLQAAWTLPGDALRRAASGTRNWLSVMFFFRYSI